MNLRVLQVITSLRVGGAEEIVVHLSARLRKLGYHVDIAVFDGEDSPLFRQASVRVFRLGHSAYDPRAIVKLIRVMRCYDIVHTHNSTPQFFAAVANMFRHKILITTEHNTNNRKRNRWLFRHIDYWMYRRYDAIVCISKVAENVLRAYLGKRWRGLTSEYGRRIHTISNGVDLAAVETAAVLPGLERMRLSGKFLITMVAGFRKQKDQDTVIRALTHLSDNFVLLLVGDGNRKSFLKELVSELSLQERVSFFGIRTDVFRILKSSDVIVMSSHWEGLSLSNIEGMSAGKPFIASDVAGLREMTKGWGLLFKEGDDRELAREITLLAEDNVYYDRVAARCKIRAGQFDISKMVTAYRKLYEKEINSPHHS